MDCREFLPLSLPCRGWLPLLITCATRRHHFPLFEKGGLSAPTKAHCFLSPMPTTQVPIKYAQREAIRFLPACFCPGLEISAREMPTLRALAPLPPFLDSVWYSEGPWPPLRLMGLTRVHPGKRHTDPGRRPGALWEGNSLQGPVPKGGTKGRTWDRSVLPPAPWPLCPSAAPSPWPNGGRMLLGTRATLARHEGLG